MKSRMIVATKRNEVYIIKKILPLHGNCIDNPIDSAEGSIASKWGE